MPENQEFKPEFGLGMTPIDEGLDEKTEDRGVDQPPSLVPRPIRRRKFLDRTTVGSSRAYGHTAPRAARAAFASRMNVSGVMRSISWSFRQAARSLITPRS